MNDSDFSVGGSSLPKEVFDEVSDFINRLDKVYEFKHGSTSAFWHLVYTLGQHLGKGKP